MKRNIVFHKPYKNLMKRHKGCIKRNKNQTIFINMLVSLDTYKVNKKMPKREYKNPPQVRAYLRKTKADYRARLKQKLSVKKAGALPRKESRASQQPPRPKRFNFNRGVAT
jgi:hypothetical protein